MLGSHCACLLCFAWLVRRRLGSSGAVALCWMLVGALAATAYRKHRRW
jgi:hypothetical protein